MNIKDSVHLHFRYVARVLSFFGCFCFSENFPKSFGALGGYSWSPKKYFFCCVLKIAQFFFMYFNLSPLDTPGTIKFGMDVMHAVLDLLLALFNKTALLNLLFEIELYDIQKLMFKSQRRPMHLSNYSLKLGYSCAFLFCALPIFFAAVCYISFKDIDTFPYNLSLILSLIHMASFTFTVPFLFFTHEISLRYKKLYEHFMDEINTVHSQHIIETVLDNHRLLFFQLSNVLRGLNRCFGLSSTLFFCYSYFIFLGCIYDFLRIDLRLMSTCTIAKYVVEIYIVAIFAEDIMKERKEFASVLRALPVLRLSSRNQKHMIASVAAYITVVINLVPPEHIDTMNNVAYNHSSDQY